MDDDILIEKVTVDLKTMDIKKTEPSEVSSTGLLSAEEQQLVDWINEGKSFGNIQRERGLHLHWTVIVHDMMRVIQKLSDNREVSGCR